MTCLDFAIAPARQASLLIAVTAASLSVETAAMAQVDVTPAAQHRRGVYHIQRYACGARRKRRAATHSRWRILPPESCYELRFSSGTEKKEKSPASALISSLTFLLHDTTTLAERPGTLSPHFPRVVVVFFVE